jgi:hypothetical protein
MKKWRLLRTTARRSSSRAWSGGSDSMRKTISSSDSASQPVSPGRGPADVGWRRFRGSMALPR